MRKYRIDDSFETIGAFWRFGQEENTFTGTLTCREGRVQALSSPSYVANLDENAVAAAFRELNSRNKWSHVTSLCGFTAEDVCTLLNATVSGSSSNTNLSLGKKISTTSYVPVRTVMGFHVEAADSPSFDGCAFYFTKVHHLLPPPWRTRMSLEDTSYVAPTQPKEIFTFFSHKINAEVVCEVTAGGHSKFRKSASIKSVPRIRINLKARQSVDWLTALAFRTENFLALFLGASIGLKRLQFFQEDHDGWLLQKMNHRREKVDEQLIIRCPLLSIAEAYDKWLSASEDRRPLELVVLGMLRKSTLFEETKFVSLAQALEGFGRLAHGVKQSLSFASLIEQSYDSLSTDFAMQLVGDKAKFIRQIVDTRTYYVHIGKPVAPAATRDNKGLFLLNKRLQAFIRCLMLLDLSVPEEYLREPILHQASRWQVV